MLAVLWSRPGLKVAAWHAARPTGNPEDTGELIRVCAAGGDLAETPAGGSCDVSAATGRKRFRDDANDAACEVDHDSERVLAARAEVAAGGRWLGGERPSGWELDKNRVDGGGKPVRDDDGNPVKGILPLRQDEADARAQARGDVPDGATVGGIARNRDTRGILAPAGKQWRGREAGRVLRRARDAGLMEYRGRITGTAPWPPVVDETTGRATVARMGDPGRTTAPGPARRHLLTWLARCGVCGAPVVCRSTSRAAAKGRERRLVYRCREDTQGHVARDRAAVDDLVTRLVLARLSRADARDRLAKDNRDELTSPHREAGPSGN